MASQNQIETLTLDIKMHSSAAGKQAGEEVDDIVDSDVLPVLEKVTEEYGSCDLDIGSLEIDLGRVSRKDFPVFLERELRNRLDIEFRNRPDSISAEARDVPGAVSGDTDGSPSDAFRSLLADYIGDGSVTIEEYAAPAPAGSPRHRAGSGPATDFPLQKVRVLLEYLTSPGIPWNMEISDTEAYKALKAALASPVQRPSADVFLSLTGGLDIPTLARMDMLLKEIIAGGNTETAVHGDATGPEDSPDFAEVRNFIETPDFAETLLEVEKVVSEKLTASGGPAPETLGRRLTLWREYLRERDIAGGNNNNIISVIPDEKEGGTGAPFYIHPDVPGGESVLPGDGIPADETGNEVWRSTPGEGEDPLTKRLFISDAGLVLIHPFITGFLRALYLVDEHDAFVSEMARVHAVHLLRHITGSEEPHLGHNLLLEKVLCGLPPDYVIPAQWKSVRREEEEIENMLKAAMSYWGPLRNSSTETLKRGFLLRAGSIERTDDNVIVRVEGSAMDILLEDLPWQISVIVLPWLDKPIFTEWQK